MLSSKSSLRLGGLSRWGGVCCVVLCCAVVWSREPGDDNLEEILFYRLASEVACLYSNLDWFLGKF